MYTVTIPGSAFKSVRAVSTTNINVASAVYSHTIDGVSCSDGEAFLLTAQTNTAENGIWIAQGDGIEVLAVPIPGPAVKVGESVNVLFGSVNQNTIWIKTNLTVFTKASGAGGGGSGFSGYSGASNISGFSGYSGRSGFSGYSGAGASGFSGYSGTSGTSGRSGFSGYSGAAGGNGASGFSGYSGTAGGVGASGFSGYSGRSGFSGYSGGAGAGGSSGFSGYSGNGLSGFSGYSGSGGSSGPTSAVTATRYFQTGNRVAGGTGIATDRILFSLIHIPVGMTINRIGVAINTATASTTVRLGIYNNGSQGPSTLVIDGGTVDSSTTGDKEVTITSTVLTAGWYWIADTSGSATAGQQIQKSINIFPVVSWFGATGTATQDISTARTTTTSSAWQTALPATAPSIEVNQTNRQLWIRFV